MKYTHKTRAALAVLLLPVVPLMARTPSFAAAATPPARQINARSVPEGDVERAYFYSPSGDEDRVLAFYQKLLRGGATRVNCFLPSVIVCDLPVGFDADAILAGNDIIQALESAIDDRAASAPIFGLRWTKRVYGDMDRLVGMSSGTAEGGAPVEFNDRVFTVPDEALRRTGAPRSTVGTLIEDRRIDQNSEILAGTVLARLVLPESAPSLGNTENWTAAAISGAVSQATLGMLYYQRHYNRVDLNFIVDRVEADTDVEPIRFAPADEDQWIGDVMSKLGFDQTPEDAKATVHAFNEEGRMKRGTDWVFTAFIVRAENAPDHRFAGVSFNGWSYLGGPYLVLPFPVGAPPRSSSLVGNFTQNFSHYFGHIFWALDEHAGASHGCATRSGYLDVANLNKTVRFGPSGGVQGCSGGVPKPCIMNLTDATVGLYGGEPCEYTAGMLGLSDENNNSVPDALDLAPALEFEHSGIDTIDTDSVVLRFTAVSQGVSNRNPQQRAPRNRYRVPVKQVGRSSNGVLAQTMTPLDGEYDEVEEEFAIEIPQVTPGLSQITFITKNTAGAAREVAKKVYFVGLSFLQFRFDAATHGTRISWNMLGETFGAQLDLHRYEQNDPATETTVVSNVQPIGAPSPPFTRYTALDTLAEPGKKYTYFVEGRFTTEYKGSSRDFVSKSIEVNAVASMPIRHGLLSDISPNPFRDQTHISIVVPPSYLDNDPQTTFREETPTRVDAAVFDVAGRLVKHLYEDAILSQVVTLTWDGTTQTNEPAPSGVYFIRVTAGPQEGSKKVVLVR